VQPGCTEAPSLPKDQFRAGGGEGTYGAGGEAVRDYLLQALTGSGARRSSSDETVAWRPGRERTKSRHRGPNGTPAVHVTVLEIPAGDQRQGVPGRSDGEFVNRLRPIQPLLRLDPGLFERVRKQVMWRDGRTVKSSVPDKTCRCAKRRGAASELKVDGSARDMQSTTTGRATVAKCGSRTLFARLHAPRVSWWVRNQKVRLRILPWWKAARQAGQLLRRWLGIFCLSSLPVVRSSLGLLFHRFEHGR
jgi:hypothetical protein